MNCKKKEFAGGELRSGRRKGRKKKGEGAARCKQVLGAREKRRKRKKYSGGSTAGGARRAAAVKNMMN